MGSAKKKVSSKKREFSDNDIQYDVNTTTVQVSSADDLPEKSTKKEGSSTPQAKKKVTQNSKDVRKMYARMPSTSDDDEISKMGDESSSSNIRSSHSEDSENELAAKKRKSDVNYHKKRLAAVDAGIGSPATSRSSPSPRRKRQRSAEQSKTTGVVVNTSNIQRFNAKMPKLRLNMLKMDNDGATNCGPGGDDSVSVKRNGKTKSTKSSTVKGLDRCVLCVLEDQRCTSKLKRQLQKEISAKFDVKTKNVFIWQDLDWPASSISKQSMLYFIKDLTNFAIDGKRTQLERMLLDQEFVKKKNVSEYQLQASFLEELDDQDIITKTKVLTWTKVDNRLKESKGVGEVLRFEGKPSLLMFLDDEGIDCNGTIRKSLGLEEEEEEEEEDILITWTPATVVTYLSEDTDSEMRSLEYSTIISWFQNQILSEVVVYPQDDILVPESTENSVVEDLANSLKCVKDADNSYRVVALKHLDSDVVNVEAYCRRAVHIGIRSSLDSNSGLVVLLDMQSLLEKDIQQQLSSIFRDEDGAALSITTRSAFDPSSIVVSCIIIEVHLHATQVQKSQSPSLKPCSPTKCIQDNETPSTSRKGIYSRKSVIPLVSARRSERMSSASSSTTTSATSLSATSLSATSLSATSLSASSSSSSSAAAAASYQSSSPASSQPPTLRSSKSAGRSRSGRQP